MVSATKRSEHAAKSKVTVNAVTKHRLAGDSHSAVFPSHIGENHWHGSHRNGHLGTHTVSSKTKK